MTYRIILATGILTLLTGIYLYLNHISSAGFSTSRSGGTINGEVTGMGAIIIALILFILSAIAYKMYKDDKKKLDKME